MVEDGVSLPWVEMRCGLHLGHSNRKSDLRSGRARQITRAEPFRRREKRARSSSNILIDLNDG